MTFVSQFQNFRQRENEKHLETDFFLQIPMVILAVNPNIQLH